MSHKSVVCSAQGARGEEWDIHGRWPWQRLEEAREGSLEAFPFWTSAVSSTSTIVSNVASSRVQSGITPVPTLSPSMSTIDSPKRTASPVCISLCMYHVYVLCLLLPDRPRVLHP